MEDSQSLDALENIMNDVGERPFDIAIHIRHIQLAQSIQGMEAEALAARELMSQCLAVGDAVWMPLLDAKEQMVDLDTEEGVQELLALYARAEADYFCKSTRYEALLRAQRHPAIPILQQHLQFLIDRHSHYTTEENLRPDTLGDTFTTAWTREAINEVVQKGINHLTEVCLFFTTGIFFIFMNSIRAESCGIPKRTGRWKYLRTRRNLKSKGTISKSNSHAD